MSETLTRPNVRQAVPFFMVEDMRASLAFYTDGLGFQVTNYWDPDGRIEWCSLTLGEATLMLQVYRPGAMPAIKRGTGVSICFICEDAIALWRSFCGRGVEASRPFVGNNMWVTELTDPDGYHLLFESPTDAPEESELEGD